jgi:hypothetical protein
MGSSERKKPHPFDPKDVKVEAETANTGTPKDQRLQTV